MASLPGLTKDPSPPATDTEIAPITIPNGTVLVTTRVFNKIIDYLSGDAGPDFIPQNAIANLTTDLSAKEVTVNKNAVNGYAGLDASSKLAVSQIPTAIPQANITDLTTDLSSKQPIDSSLTEISGLTLSNDDILQQKAGVLTNRTPVQFKADLSLVKADVGLANVDNTSDADKPVSTAQQTALNLKEDLSNKGAVNGYAPLGATSLVPVANLGSGTPDGTKFLRDDGVFVTPAGGAGLTFAKVVKTIDETISSQATAQDDDVLKATLAINKTYSFMMLVYLTSSAIANFRWQFGIPAGATGLVSVGPWNGTVAGVLGNIALDNTVPTNGIEQIIQFTGKITMGGTPGDLQFRWRQSVSEASNTTVHRGSTLIVWEEG